MFISVCVCVRGRERACVRVYKRVCACVRPAAGDEGPEPVGEEVNAELDDEEDCEDGVELRAV